MIPALKILARLINQYFVQLSFKIVIGIIFSSVWSIEHMGKGEYSSPRRMSDGNYLFLKKIWLEIVLLNYQEHLNRIKENRNKELTLS